MPAQGSPSARVNPTKLPAAGVRTKNLVKRPNKFGPATPDQPPAARAGQSAGAASDASARSWDPNASGAFSASGGAAGAAGAAAGAAGGGASGGAAALSASGGALGGTRKWTVDDRDGVRRAPAHASPVAAHNQSLLARSGGAIAGTGAAAASAGSNTWTAAHAAAATGNGSSPRAVAGGSGGAAGASASARRDGKWDVSDAPAPAADARATVVGAAFFDGGDPSNRRITFASGLGFGRGHPWFNSYLNFPNAQLGTLTPADLLPPATEQHAIDAFAGGLGFGPTHSTYHAYLHSNAKHARPPK